MKTKKLDDPAAAAITLERTGLTPWVKTIW
jgi:hypothetical protein